MMLIFQNRLVGILPVFTILYLSIISCSPKPVTDMVESKPEPTSSKTLDPEPSLTSCITLDQLDPSLRSEVEDAFTLYRDQIRFENYADALSLWKKAFYNAPGANGRVSYHFDDGIKIYDHLFNQTSDKGRKSELVDTIMQVYAKRLECFPDDGSILARRAFDSYYKYSEFTDPDQIFLDFKEVVRKKGLKADYFIINPFSKLLYDRVVETKIELEEAKSLTAKIFEIIEHGIKNCKGQYCEAWEIINEYSPELLSGLEGIRGYYDCNYYLNKYYSQFLADSSNCDNVTEVYLKMVWAACPENNPKFIQLHNAKERECYVPPPPPGPLKLAYSALEEGNFTEAIDYFEQYVDETDEADKKADKLLIIAKIYYAHIKNYPQSRKYALDAAKYRPSWGEPYILIGKLYASSGPICGPGRGWDSQIVTWPAIDKFEYARRIDPSVADEATKYINQYSRYMPSVEDIFQRQLKENSSFRVGCWIQENTTIRAARG